MCDLIFSGHGSIYLLRAPTEFGQDWLDQRINPETLMWCGSVVVEHSYVQSIMDGALHDGLIVEIDGRAFVC